MYAVVDVCSCRCMQLYMYAVIDVCSYRCMQLYMYAVDVCSYYISYLISSSVSGNGSGRLIMLPAHNRSTFNRRYVIY